MSSPLLCWIFSNSLHFSYLLWLFLIFR